MKTTHIALLWAVIILAAAAYSNFIGMSDAGSAGMTLGLVGAAWGSIEGNRRRSNKACCS